MEISQRQQTWRKKNTVNWTICNAHVNCNYSSFIASVKEATECICNIVLAKRFLLMSLDIAFSFNLIYDPIITYRALPGDLPLIPEHKTIGVLITAALE